jgi:cell wall-associated NlpC family hydrolase
MTREQVVAEARQWVGVPWLHQGRSHAGVDCVGLVVLVAASFGLVADDRTDYARNPNSAALLAHLRRQLVRVAPTANHIGVVGIFRQSNRACHVGIISWRDNALHLVHAAAARKRVEEAPLAQLGYSLIEAGAFPGLQD